MSLILSSDRSVRQRHASEDEISLPEDLMIDILLRVPAQTILVFRRLSKYYRELTGSGEFIRKHNEVSMKTRPGIILHQRIYHGRLSKPNPVVIQLDFESGFKVDEFIPPFKDEGDELRFLGCQRGILCYIVEVNTGLDHLIFWNPITGVGRKSRCTDTISMRYWSNPCASYFFGYDSVTDVFKVLKIRVFENGSDCAVYSSKTDSWTRTGGFGHIKNDRRHRLNLDPAYQDWTGAEVFVEGSNCNYVHMLARFYNLKNGHFYGARQVLAYDFIADKFNLVPLPKSLYDVFDFNLSSVGGCLCLLTSRRPASSDHNLEAWIMKDYGDAESWAILFTVEHDYIPSPLRHPRSIGLVVINGHLQLLMQSNYHVSANGSWPESELYIYDVHRKQFNNAQCDLDDVHKKQLNRVLMNNPVPRHFLFVPSCRQP